MVRNHCIRSFILSSILVAVIIVSQIFLIEDTSSDTENFGRESEVSVIVTDTGDEHEWRRQKAIRSFSLICQNCTFTNGSSINRTSDNDTVRMSATFHSYLRGYIHRLNRAPVVRNLDKFDLHADSDGSVVIVIQVQTLFIHLLVLYSTTSKFD